MTDDPKSTKVPGPNAAESYMVNAVDGLVVNGATPRDIRKALSRALSGGYHGADTLHDIYTDFGYPEQVTFEHCWNMYRRFGIAKNVVDLPSDTCWMDAPTLEGDSGVLGDIERIAKRLRLWHRLNGLDKRQRVGRYAGLYMRVRDGKEASQPLEGGLSGPESLFDIIPLYESQLEVIEFDSNPRSLTYGQPTMYQMRGGVDGERNEWDKQTVRIHPSRVVIWAEGADDGTIFGVSALEAPFNSLMDLQKITGSAGEGFYKNASQNIVFGLDPNVAKHIDKDTIEKFNERFDEFSRDRARRALLTPGMTAGPLNSQMSSPKDAFICSINDVSAASKIPATILMGQQTGRLASDQDSRAFLSISQSRRENFLTAGLMDVIEWMQTYGVVRKGAVEVEWSDLLEMSDQERLQSAAQMAEINSKQFTSGGDAPFSGEEIREQAGYEADEMLDDDGEGDEPLETPEE